MSNKTQSFLWRLTGLAALALLAMTIMLAVQAGNQTAVGVSAHIEEQVYLRDQPHGAGQIIGVLRRGTAVTITNSFVRGQTTWYEIATDNTSGWVPDTVVNLDTLEER